MRRQRFKWICIGLAIVSILMGIGLCSMEGRASSTGKQSGSQGTLPLNKALQRAKEAANIRNDSVRGKGKADDWKLLLVNPWHKLPEGFSPKLTRLKNGHAVDKRAYPQLQRMMDDARAHGLSPLICSSYRTEEMQKRLYREQTAVCLARGYEKKAAGKEAAKWVAVPGTSEHQTGLALDIVSEGYQLLNEAQADTPEQKWLMKNAHKYGFILRYPKEKTEITGIGYEPWHYRYVGKKAARQIYQQGICLEEYLKQPAGQKD
ncbi:MAG: M15 family metallopeptidase [Firmicutes bacterium]|nr:M15 family metallopeptidase [Bacillota bacterium]